MPPRNTYRIIAGKQNRHQKNFLTNNHVAIDFPSAGFKLPLSRHDIRDLLLAWNGLPRQVDLKALVGQADTFINDIQIGDLVIVFVFEAQKFAVGVVQSETKLDMTQKQPLYRDVKWLPEPHWIAKQNLSIVFNNSVISNQTVLRLWPEHQQELIQMLPAHELA